MGPATFPFEVRIILFFFRQIRSCHICFLENHGEREFKCRALGDDRKIELCKMFGYTFRQNKVVAPNEMFIVGKPDVSVDAKHAEVKGKCFFSSIFHSIVGVKSGKSYLAGFF